MYVVNPDCKEARSVVSAEKLSHSIVPQLKFPSALKEKLEKNRIIKRSLIFNAQELSPEQVYIFLAWYRLALIKSMKNKPQ